jgi:hypothetical protein
VQADNIYSLAVELDGSNRYPNAQGTISIGKFSSTNLLNPPWATNTAAGIYAAGGLTNEPIAESLYVDLGDGNYVVHSASHWADLVGDGVEYLAPTSSASAEGKFLQFQYSTGAETAWADALQASSPINAANITGAVPATVTGPWITNETDTIASVALRGNTATTTVGGMDGVSTSDFVTVSQWQSGLEASEQLYFYTNRNTAYTNEFISTNLYYSLETNYPNTATISIQTGVGSATNNGYCWGFISTNATFTSLSANTANFEVWLNENGAGSVSVTMEFYGYDVVSNALTGELCTPVLGQVVPSGSAAGKLLFSVPYADLVFPNPTFLAGRMKITSLALTPTIIMSMGNGTPSHMGIDVPNDVMLAPYFKKDGSVDATGNFNMGGKAVTNASDIVATNSMTVPRLISETNTVFTNSTTSGTAFQFASSSSFAGVNLFDFLVGTTSKMRCRMSDDALIVGSVVANSSISQFIYILAGGFAGASSSLPTYLLPWGLNNNSPADAVSRIGTQVGHYQHASYGKEDKSTGGSQIQFRVATVYNQATSNTVSNTDMVIDRYGTNGTGSQVSLSIRDHGTNRWDFNLNGSANAYGNSITNQGAMDGFVVPVVVTYSGSTSTITRAHLNRWQLAITNSPHTISIQAADFTTNGAYFSSGSIFSGTNSVALDSSFLKTNANYTISVNTTNSWKLMIDADALRTTNTFNVRQ